MPLAVVIVVQALRFVAVHGAAAALSPLSVTVAPAPGAAPPTGALLLTECGPTLSASATGGAVTTRESMILAGEPIAPAAVTVMVST